MSNTALYDDSMKVQKQDGSYETFAPLKLNRSLTRSGASKEVRDKIIAQVESQLYDGITTSEIYKLAFRILRNESDTPDTVSVTFRYSLRRSISDFGPSGFPFEKFVGELFRLQGYKIDIGKKIKGACVTHEMDVIGRKDNEIFTAELKFHNRQNIKTDVKVALYIRSRFNDLISGGFYEGKKQRLAIITNTKFSSDAIRYGQCSGLELIGWNFPKKGHGNLHDLIQQSGIHPLTCLSTLSKKQKDYFLEQGLVLCRELAANNYQVLHETKNIVPRSKVPKIIEEIERIRACTGNTCAKE